MENVFNGQSLNYANFIIQKKKLVFLSFTDNKEKGITEIYGWIKFQKVDLFGSIPMSEFNKLFVKKIEKHVPFQFFYVYQQ